MIDLNSFMACGCLLSAKEGHLLVGWGKREWIPSPLKGSPISFFFPDFFLTDSTPWFVHENNAEISIPHFLDILKKEPDSKAPQAEWKNLNKTLFYETFNELQVTFSTDILQKAVPYVFEISETEVQEKNIHYMLQHALSYANQYPVHVYGFWDNLQGILGVTPEKLFTLKSKGIQTCVETMACAATYPDSLSDDLMKNPKQLHEHALVIEGIMQSLSPLGSVSKGSTRVLKLPGLSHLVTPITLIRNGSFDVKELVQAIHPTPALGAFPKEAGIHWLTEYDKKLSRERFGAPVGYYSPEGRASCFVAIRNVQWSQKKMKIGAGCGIIPESQFQNEWHEINLKLRTIKNILGL